MFVGCGPVKGGGHRPCRGSGGNKGASDKFSGGVGSVDEGKTMGVNKMVDKVGTKLERAASGHAIGIRRRGGRQGKGSHDSGRGRVASKKFSGGECTDVRGA